MERCPIFHAFFYQVTYFLIIFYAFVGQSLGIGRRKQSIAKQEEGREAFIQRCYLQNGKTNLLTTLNFVSSQHNITEKRRSIYVFRVRGKVSVCYNFLCPTTRSLTARLLRWLVVMIEKNWFRFIN